MCCHGTDRAPGPPGREYPGRFSPSPTWQHERPGGSAERLFLRGLEHRGRGGAVQRRHGRCPATSSDHRTPSPASAAATRTPAAPERVRTYGIGVRPAACHEVQRPGRVDQAAVMRGHLRIRPVQLRVVQVRLVHPVFRLSGTSRAGVQRRIRTPRRGTRSRALVHLQHRPYEHVREYGSTITNACTVRSFPLTGPASGPAARSRSAPAPRPQTGAGSTPSPGTGGPPPEISVHVTAEARHAGARRARPQPLVDRRHPHLALSCSTM